MSRLTSMGVMDTSRRHAVAALVAAGLLWGSTVPLSKLAMAWLAPGWLTVARFGLAAAVLLPVARRRGLRVPEVRVLASGAAGYGCTIIVQNAGIMRTSVIHAALLIGAVPVLVAVIAAVWHGAVARPLAWLGFAVSLGGVGLVTAGGGGGASAGGDGLVLVSLVLSAAFTVVQGRLLPGRDPVTVTAVQFLGAALGALPVAVLSEGAPAGPGRAGPVLAVAALAVAGTLVPFTLFAYGQSRVPAQVAGAFLNLEPLVGAMAGIMFFGDPAGPKQLAGGLAVVAGIGLSAVPAGSAEVRAEPGQAGGHNRPGWAGRPTVGGTTTLSRQADSGVEPRPFGRKIADLSWRYGDEQARGGRRARRRRWRPARPGRR
jgi:O-acetylserine/cysteine efflux transporter